MHLWRHSHYAFLDFSLLFCGKFPISDSLVLGITLIIDLNFTLSLRRPIRNLFSTVAHLWPQLHFFLFILTNQNVLHPNFPHCQLLNSH